MEMFGRGALLTLLCPCECSIDERPSKAWARSLPHLRYHPKSRLPRPHPREIRRDFVRGTRLARSEEHTSELQSLMRISYAVFCLKKTTNTRSPIIIYTLN